MSRELYAYSETDQPMRRSDLDEGLAALGWGYLLFEDLDSFREAPADSYLRSCDILVWDEDGSASVKRAISARDRAALDKLYETNVAGAVFVDLELPYEPDEETIEELEESDVDSAIVERIAAARLSYSVRTAAGRNDFSLEAQTAIANLLAIALYGVLEDPQEGTFENFARELVEDDDDEPPAAKRPWWKFW